MYVQFSNVDAAIRSASHTFGTGSGIKHRTRVLERKSKRVVQSSLPDYNNDCSCICTSESSAFLLRTIHNNYGLISMKVTRGSKKINDRVKGP